MKMHRANDHLYMFWCPGCDEAHSISTAPGRWQYDHNDASPTITPSILVRATQPLTDEQHALVMSGEPFTPLPRVCHSFVRDGRIQFLSDCTHALAGQTVDLPEWNDGV